MKVSRYLFICISFLSVFSIYAQSVRERGIEAYRKGEYQSAINSFETITSSNKKDAEAWNILGMSYLKVSRFTESRKAFEKAVKLKPENVEFRTNLAFANLKENRLKQAEKEAKRVIKSNPKNAKAFYIRGVVFLVRRKFGEAIANANESINLDKSSQDFYLLKLDAIIYKFGQEYEKGKKLTEMTEPLQKSIEALENCISKCVGDLSSVQAKLDDLKIFYQYFSSQQNSNDNSNITEISLLSKPRANYTDSARQNQVQGTITLAIFFSADGNTKRILVLNPLRLGLTEQAILAAQKIKFNPQMEAGKPISVVKLVQYGFLLY